MKKLKLDVDALHVESFEAERGEGARGTVLGADSEGSGNIYCISAEPCVPTNEATGGCHTCFNDCNPWFNYTPNTCYVIGCGFQDLYT